MFTRPKNGWTEIHLEDFEGLGSYIQDIPVMVLDRGVQSVQERTPLKLWFDEEESAFTLTADEETKIVTEGEFGAEEYNIKCSKLDLIREIFFRLGDLFGGLRLCRGGSRGAGNLSKTRKNAEEKAYCTGGGTAKIYEINLYL